MGGENKVTRFDVTANMFCTGNFTTPKLLITKLHAEMNREEFATWRF